MFIKISKQITNLQLKSTNLSYNPRTLRARTCTKQAPEFAICRASLPNKYEAVYIFLYL